MNALLLLVPLALAAGDAAPDSTARRYSGRDRELEVDLPRHEAPVTIDGRLDEDVWSRAARLTGFSRYAPVDDEAAPDSTEVLVWYSAHAIHFGIRAWAEPGTVRASHGDRDKTYTDDYIGIFLATQAGRREATVFAVNPFGVQGDGIVVEGTRTSGGGFEGAQIGREPTDISPDYVFQSKGRLTDYGYEVEVRVPFRSLQFADADRQRWAVNVIRRVQSRGEEHSWAPARRAAASYIAQFGHLAGLADLDRGRVLDITPILTARMAGGAEGDAWDYDGGRPQFGANVRYGLTSSLTLSATLRPDFAEVESDAGQAVSDPRMLLYFPEKRPFFLEGAEQFAAPGNLLYTRRIADPSAAAKITGTVAGTSTAMLVARESRASSLTTEGHPLFTWLRSTRQVGGDSRVGVLYTGREDDGTSNRVAGADARLVWGGVYAVQALAALSRTDLGTGDVRTAPMVQVIASRSGRHLASRWLFSSIANDFFTASGFIARDSVARVNVDHGYTVYGKPGALVQTATADVVLDGTWRYSRFVHQGDAIEKKLHVNTNYGLRGGWRLGASVLVETFGFDPDYYGQFAVERHEGGAVVDTVPFTGTPRLPNLDYLVTATTPNFRHLSANLFYLWGRDENFFEWASADIQWATLNVDWRPTTQLRVSQSYNMQSYRRRTDGSLVASNHIPRLKVEYQLRRALLVRAVGEYEASFVDTLRDDSRTGDPLLRRLADGRYARLPGGRANAFRPQLLVAYTPVPGTVLYAGWDAALAEEDAWRFRRLQRERDGLFVKASWLFRL